LGETFQAIGQDGTKIFLEQTEHHPPVSSFIFDGPNGIYKMNGWNSFIAKAWVNSATLAVEGRKEIVF
jgi:hypothetical protein